MIAQIPLYTFVSQKIESVHFYSCLQAKFSPRFSLLIAGTKLPIPPKQHFLKIYFFPSRKGEGWGEDNGVENLPKLNLRGYWSQVLISSTIFATFTLLASVLLCHNLASSMLKCEGSST